MMALLSWQQPPASASPPDNQGNRAASSSKSRNYCRTVDVATIDVVHSKDAVIHLFQIEMKCLIISNNPGTRLCGGNSKKSPYFSEGFSKRQHLGHHLDGAAYLELALHHRALADRGDVDRVLARARGVVPWNSQ